MSDETRKVGDPMTVRTCHTCPLNGLGCEHPDTVLVAPLDTLRQAQIAEMIFAHVDGGRPTWCPLNRRSLVLRAWRPEPITAAALTEPPR